MKKKLREKSLVDIGIEEIKRMQELAAEDRSITFNIPESTFISPIKVDDSKIVTPNSFYCFSVQNEDKHTEEMKQNKKIKETGSKMTLVDQRKIEHIDM